MENEPVQSPINHSEPSTALRIWTLLSAVAAFGTYAAMFIPAFVGQEPTGQSLLSVMFWSWLFGFLVWKLRSKPPWQGGLIGLIIAFVAGVGATMEAAGTLNVRSIMSAAIIGALSGALAQGATYLVSTEKAKSATRVLLFTVLFAGLGAASSNFVLPVLNKNRDLAEVTDVFDNHEVYAVLREFEPEVHARLKRVFLDAVEQGADLQQAQVDVRIEYSELMTKRLPRVADGTLLKYTEFTVEQLNAFRDYGKDVCFKSLFPQVGGAVNVMDILDEGMISREIEVQRLVFETYDSSISVPTEDWAMERMQPVYDTIFETYGDGAFDVYNDPADPTLDRDLVCDVTISLYGEILKLPEEDAIGVLRWMFE